MKLLNTNETKWDENIKLELTLRELQIIRDSMGATSYNDKKYIWDENCAECPYNSDQNKNKGENLYSPLWFIFYRVISID